MEEVEAEEEEKEKLTSEEFHFGGSLHQSYLAWLKLTWINIIYFTSRRNKFSKFWTQLIRYLLQATKYGCKNPQQRQPPEEDGIIVVAQERFKAQ